jgi:hypothetical protein
MANLMCATFATCYRDPAKGEVLIVFLRVQFIFKDSISMYYCTQFHIRRAHFAYPSFLFLCKMVKFLAYTITYIGKVKQG